jgi:hypothetical protein
VRRGRGWSVRAWLVVLAVLGVAPPALAEPPWTAPLEGLAVGRDFAPPADPYGSGHRGVDLEGTAGSPVLAAGAGRVSYAGLLAGRGVVVVVHGALRTTYEPVSAAVRAGDAVASGQLLGTLDPGHPGCAVAACLHWGLRRGQEYLDPLTLVGGGPVRLLPLQAAGPAARVPGTVPAPVAAPAAPGPVERVATRPVPPDVPAGPPVTEPSWSLRAAEAPLGAVAVVALVAGIGLLARPRPGPAGPASGGAASAAPPPAGDEPALGHAALSAVTEPGRTPPAQVVDLERARAQRRTG